MPSNDNFSEIFDFDLDDELIKELYNNINPNYSKRKRMFYLYFKLCTLLQIDPCYSFSYKIDRNTAKKYFAKNPTRLETINLKNNKVNCFEFKEVFNKLARMEQNTHDKVELYGSSEHVYSVINIDNVKISFDALWNAHNILDIISVKLQEGFDGIKCLDKNMYSIIKMEASDVYEDIIF